MASWKQHAKDSNDILGEQWVVVHQWLDEYAKIYWPMKIHRIHRHHLEGVEECSKKWGDEAAEAAIIHILKDEGDVLSAREIEERYNIRIKKGQKK